MSLHDGHRARKKEQFLLHGLDCFAEHEALELLLFYVLPRRDTNPLAHRLLETFGSLKAVLNAEPEHLMQVEGVGESTAVFLSLLGAVYRRMDKMPHKKARQCFGSVKNSYDYFKNLLRKEPREALYMACLDSSGHLLNCRKVADGDVSAVQLPLRKMVQDAMLCGASTVILAHNHPSGVASASERDYCATAVVYAEMEKVGIELRDHIIVAGDDCLSMNQAGLLQDLFHGPRPRPHHTA